MLIWVIGILRGKITFLIIEILTIGVEQIPVSPTPEESKMSILNYLLGFSSLRWIGTASHATLVSVIALIAYFNHSLKRMQCYRKSFMYGWISHSPPNNT